MYASVQEMLAEYDSEPLYELRQLVPTPVGLADETAITEALIEASGLMDEYIGSRYALPLASLTASRAAWLRRVCLEIARFLLWRDRASEEVRKRHEGHMAYLRDLARGTVSWPEIAQPTASASGSPGVLSADPVFSADFFSDF